MNKAIDLLGSATALYNSAMGAWNNVNPITGVDETANNINRMGNTQFAAGDLSNLSNQFTNAANIQTSGLINRQQETFGDYFSSGMNGANAGQLFGHALFNVLPEETQNDINQNMADRLTAAEAKYAKKKADGGDLFGLVASMVGAIANPIINAVSTDVQNKKADYLNHQYAQLAQTTQGIMADRLSTALTDSTSMAFDAKALLQKAYGGPMGCFWDTFDNGVRYIKNGGTHEENPHEGVPQGIAPDGLPNLVEEGEVIYNDFVYSDRLKLTKEQAHLLKLGGEMSFAEAALKLSKESEERPNDIISKNGLRDSMNKLKMMQEDLKAKNDEKKLKRAINKFLKDMSVIEEQSVENTTVPQNTEITDDVLQQLQTFALGGHLFTDKGQMTNWYDGLTETPDITNIQGDVLYHNGKYYQLPTINRFDSNYNGQALRWVLDKPAVGKEGDENYQAAIPGHWEVIPGNGPQEYKSDPIGEALRMAPFYGSLIHAAQALKAKPNYQHLDAAIRATANTPYVNFNPIGNYTRFNRIDPNIQANALRAAQALATSNLQNSGASRAAVNASLMTGLLNLNEQLGKAYQTGLEYNNLLTDKELQTKLAVDTHNSTLSLDVNKTNLAKALAYALAVLQMAAAKQQIDDILEANKQTATAGVWLNLGNIGVDRLNRNQMKFMLDNDIYQGKTSEKAHGGKLKYKTYRKKR